MNNKQKKLRILWNSNAPWSISGYGTQMHDLLPLIRDEGYPTGMVAFYGLEGGKIVADGITCYPRIGDVWGSDAMVAHGQDFNADVVFTLQDIWPLDFNALRGLKRWIPVVPIDHEPIPPPVYERLKLAYRVVTYATFGYEELKRQGMHSTYIPHTVNTDVLKPLVKGETRKKLGIPDDIFLFGMVSANKDNPPRKSFQEAMDAFMMFYKRHPKSGIYFHTLLEQQGGFNIKEYAKFLGIESQIYHLPPYDQMFKVDREGMAQVYNTFDVLLAPSTNEGFGVPIVEAQSCGVPVITTDFTAMRELVIEGKTGYLAKILTKRFTPLFSYIAVPDTRSIYEGMEALFKADRTKMRDECRRHIVKHYDIRRIFKEKWAPYLDMLEREIYPDDLTDQKK